MDKRTVTNVCELTIMKSRNDVLKEIREQFGPNTPRTIQLIDLLIATWDTIDLLTEVFSAEKAKVYLQAGFESVEVTDDESE